MNDDKSLKQVYLYSDDGVKKHRDWGKSYSIAVMPFLVVIIITYVFFDDWASHSANSERTLGIIISASFVFGIIISCLSKKLLSWSYKCPYCNYKMRAYYNDERKGIKDCPECKKEHLFYFSHR